MNEDLHSQVVANRYELRETLGEGGFGAVYRAFDRLHRHELAIKRIKPESTIDPDPTTEYAFNEEERLALANEFQVLSSLRHPNIIGVLDYGFDGRQQPFFTMQIVEDAKTFTKAAVGQTTAYKLNLLVQLLQALSYLHRRGVIHRDLKPGNALVTPKGEVKVLDFGIAIHDRAGQNAAQGTFAGTLAYGAPEVLQGAEPSEASDLYAVGVMAYELLVGRHPFNIKDITQLVSEVIGKQPDLTEINTVVVESIQLETGLGEDDRSEQVDAQSLPTEIYPTGLAAGDEDTQVTVKGGESLLKDRQQEPLMDNEPTFNPATDKTSVESQDFALQQISRGDIDLPGELDTALYEDLPLPESDTASVRFQPDANLTLASIIGKLLAKSPHQRYTDALSVIADLTAIFGETLPHEPIEIRESYLQAAKFTGRAAELATLTTLLEDAQDGHGSVCLIGGESGVGKSRLIDEVRTKALVSGALVLHGQGIQEGGVPYQLWREPLRRLVLATEISDETAGVLKQIVPDIEGLLGQPVPDAPELEGASGKARLLHAITEIFRLYRQPAVLILEDLHWAIESLDVLKHFPPLIGEMPILIVGSFRDDERPDLYDEFPGATRLPLHRLSEDEIGQLSVSMLGGGGHDPNVIELLSRESEGNIFFLIEVVRALAEDAGHLSNIGASTLPARVFAGGVQAVLERRLSRIPRNAHDMLAIAAIAGRQIDMQLMVELFPDIDHETWLTTCLNAAVMDVHDEQWRFAHDKLREGILASIPEDVQKTCHEQVAKGLEVAHPEELDEFAAMIADHYDHAGNPISAAKWHFQAGTVAENIFAYGPAIEHYRKALEQWKDNEAISSEQLVKLYAGLARTLTKRTEYDESVKAYRDMLAAASLAEDEAAKAYAWRGIAWARIREGNFRESYDSAAQCVEIARPADALQELNEGLQVMGWSQLSLGDLEAAHELGQEAVAVAREIEYTWYLANSLNLLGAVQASRGQYEEGAKSFEYAYTISEDLGDRQTATQLVSNLGLLLGMRGDYDGAARRFNKALSFARESGDRSSELNFLFNLGAAQVSLGDYVDAEATISNLLAMVGDAAFRELSPTYRALAEAYLGQGKLAQAQAAAEEALAKGREVESPEYIGGAWRVLGQVVAASGVPIQPMEEESASSEDMPDSYDATRCFLESERIFSEIGLEPQRALTLRAWAQYDLARGDKGQAKSRWDQAREIFGRVGADLEVERMAEVPTGTVDTD